MTDAATYSLLSQDSYDKHNLGQIVTIAGVEYKIFDQMDDLITGYQGVAYQRVGTDDVVIAHRGTSKLAETLC